MEIREARLTDAATYSCLAENDAGSARIDFTLGVIGSFVVVVGHWPVYHCIAESTVDLAESLQSRRDS